jgi:hypothetical protein
MVATTSPIFHYMESILPSVQKKPLLRLWHGAAAAKLRDIYWQVPHKGLHNFLNVHFTELELDLSHPDSSLGSQGYASAAESI